MTTPTVHPRETREQAEAVALKMVEAVGGERWREDGWDWRVTEAEAEHNLVFRVYVYRGSVRVFREWPFNMDPMYRARVSRDPNDSSTGYDPWAHYPSYCEPATAFSNARHAAKKHLQQLSAAVDAAYGTTTRTLWVCAGCNRRWRTTPKTTACPGCDCEVQTFTYKEPR